MTLTHTVVSYPDRGRWGDPSYRGNCSGYLVKDIIEMYKPMSVLDPMAGSGTTGDVCSELMIPCLTYDLKQGYDVLNPLSKRQIACDVLGETDNVGVDMIFLHPPYWNMIQYSESSVDFSNGPYSLYLMRMAQLLKWLQQLLSPNGFIALLLGDLRRAGADRTYFLTDDVTAQSVVANAHLTKEIRIIKIQHNTKSAGETDLLDAHGIKFAHEYCTILRNAAYSERH